MVKFESILKHHLDIEFGFNGLINEGVLFEKHGVFDGADVIVNSIIKKADSFIDEGIYDFNVTEDILNGNNVFFKNMDMHIQIRIVDYSTPLRGQGGYITTRSHYQKEDDKLDTIDFMFVLGLHESGSIAYYKPLLYHELVHAYENWRRLRGKKESLFVYNDRNGYYRNNEMVPRNEIEKAMKNIIYFLSNTEQRAYTAMIKAILVYYKPLNADECLKEIRKSKVWGFYNDVEKGIEIIKGCYNVKQQEEILKYFRQHGYPKVKSYKGLCNALDKKYFNFMQKLTKTSYKLICDYLEELKGHVEDYGFGY